MGGHVGVYNWSPTDQPLYQAFVRTTTRGFVSVRAPWGDRWWVGPEALSLAHRGVRLVFGYADLHEDLPPPGRDVLSKEHVSRLRPQPRTVRLSFQESIRVLQEVRILGLDDRPEIPARPPHYDDNQQGLDFFRSILGSEDERLYLDNLTLPRIFICRTAVNRYSFQNTDLHESSFTWNDFNNIDFTDADLSRADLRYSAFYRVKFVRANLEGADLRGSGFRRCEFAHANMRGAKLTEELRGTLKLSDRQQEQIRWMDAGEPPPGG